MRGGVCQQQGMLFLASPLITVVFIIVFPLVVAIFDPHCVLLASNPSQSRTAGVHFALDLKVESIPVPGRARPHVTVSPGAGSPPAGSRSSPKRAASRNPELIGWTLRFQCRARPANAVSRIS